MIQDFPLDVDSAGTGGWHQGDLPDRRSIAVAKRHGIDISGQRGRQIASGDFTEFDLIFAMDRNNLSTLRSLSPPSSAQKLHLFLDYTVGADRDVPDPYYGSDQDFEAVYSLLKEGCTALVAMLARDGS